VGTSSGCAFRANPGAGVADGTDALYLGFVGFTVPFAFAVGMLATGRVSDRWQVETRRWTLFWSAGAR